MRGDETLTVGADTYQQEGPMTTFFTFGDGRQVIDCWATRMASVRTADLLTVCSVEPAPELQPAV